MSSLNSPPLSVSQLNHKLQSCVEHFFKDVYVRGEIGSIRTKGAVYFTLKDEQQSVDGVIWSRIARYLDFQPKEGDEVEIQGRISTHKKKSHCLFVVERMRPTGEGVMQREFERIKALLQKEGLFNRKRKLPLLPRAVALVTSADSSAQRDFYKVAQRAPGTKIYFIDAVMQGDQARESIKQALYKATTLPDVDVIALTRGGGAMEHLWTFNDEHLVRFLWNCPIPLVVGIGHEDNLLIAELVADHRGNTPTGTAHMVIPDVENLKQGWMHEIQKLEHNFLRHYQRSMYTLKTLYTRFDQPPSLQPYHHALQQKQHALDQAFAHVMHHKHTQHHTLNTLLHQRAPQKRLGTAQSTCQHLSRTLKEIQILEPYQMALQTCVQQLQQSIQAVIHKHHINFQNTITQLEGLSPLAILARGYSITSDQQQVIRDPQQVTVGDRIQIRVQSGKIHAQVTAVELTDNESELDDSSALDISLVDSASFGADEPSEQNDSPEPDHSSKPDHFPEPDHSPEPDRSSEPDHSPEQSIDE